MSLTDEQFHALDEAARACPLFGDWEAHEDRRRNTGLTHEEWREVAFFCAAHGVEDLLIDVATSIGIGETVADALRRTAIELEDDRLPRMPRGRSVAFAELVSA